MEAIANRLELENIALRLEAIAIRLEAIAIRLEAMAIGFEAVAIGLEAIAIRFEAIIMPSPLDWRQALLEAIAVRLEASAIRFFHEHEFSSREALCLECEPWPCFSGKGSQSEPGPHQPTRHDTTDCP